MNPLHIPVLQDAIMRQLKEKSLKTFCDATVGLGGHAKLLLENHPEIELYIGLDQDQNALDLAKASLEPFQKKTDFICSNFRFLDQVFAEKNLPKVDGFLFDIGVSSMQLDQKERGFSFLRDGPLDMRMDENNPLTAEKVVNECSEKELGQIFRDFGEEPMWRAISKAIYKSRKQKRIKTTLELVEVIESVKKRRGRIHPATLAFQAIRIFVNQELKVLEEALAKSLDLLEEGGLLLVISFHSLEDRIVKNFLRSRAKEYGDVLLTKKPIIAEREEIKKNPRARSAKMRVLQKGEK